MKQHVSPLLIAILAFSLPLAPAFSPGRLRNPEHHITKAHKFTRRSEIYCNPVTYEEVATASRRAQATSRSSGERAWLLDPEIFDQLSSGGRRAALRLNGMEPGQRKTAITPENFEVAPQVAVGDNQRVNDPTQDDSGHTNSESSIVVNGSNIVVSFNDASLNSNGYAFSTDGGITFTARRVPTPVGGDNFGDGVVALGPNGEIYYSGLGDTSNGRSIITVAKSTDKGATFSVPVDASTSAGNTQDSQDKEWLTVDRNASSPNKGNVYVTWTDFTDNASFILSARSTNGGSSFDAPVRLSPLDNTFAVQGSQPAVAPNGDLYVAYFDTHTPNELGSLSLVKSVNGGISFNAPTTITGLTAVATQTGGGGVRTNSFPSITIGQDGTIHIVFTGVSAVLGADRGDIFYTRSTNGGVSFSAVTKLNDDNSNASQLFPSVAVASDGTVGVKWWDRRNDPLNDSLTDVYMTISTNGGASFSKNFRITNHNWAFGPVEPDFPVDYHGDYDTLTADGPTFFASWSDERGTDPDVYIAQIPANRNPNAPDFNLSTRQTFQSVVAGKSTSFDFNSRADNGFTGSLSLSATPAVSGVTYSFTTDSVTAGQPAKLTINTSASTSPGVYILTAAATGGGLTRKTTIRLVVYPASRTEGLPINATNTSGFTSAGTPQIDANGVLHLVFDDTSATGAGGQGSDIFYSRSFDGGKTFSTPVKVSSGLTLSVSPALAPDATGNLYVVWTSLNSQNQPTAFFAKSLDGGNTFSTPISFSNSSQEPIFACLAVGPNNTVLAGFTDTASTNWRFVVARSNDGGVSFGAATPVSPASDDLVFPGNVAIDSTGKAYAVFDNDITGGGDAVGVKLATAAPGQNFGSATLISQAQTAAFAPNIAIDANNKVYVTFYNRQGNSTDGFNREVILITSTDGVSFSSQRNLSNNSGQSTVPFVVAGLGGSIGLAWQDTTGNDQGDIFYTRSTDGGVNFSSAVNISANHGVSSSVFGAADKDGKLFFAWTDDSSANTEALVMAVSPTNDTGPPPTPDFSLSFNPSTVTTEPGKITLTVILNRTGGFTGNVNIPAPGTGTGKIKVSPESVDTTDNSAAFKFKIKGGAPKGARQIVFTGRDATGRIRSATLTLIVQ